jgi:hypothetical protein
MSDFPAPAAPSVSELLVKARDLIAKPEHWTTGCAARMSAGGASVEPHSMEAACWCSIGALRKVASDMSKAKVDYWSGASSPAYLSALRTLSRAIEPDCAPHRATEVVAAFNDLDTTEHQRVIGAFNAAIAMAKGTV